MPGHASPVRMGFQRNFPAPNFVPFLTVLTLTVIQGPDKGRLIEQGSHNELMAIRRGAYRALLEQAPAALPQRLW